MSTPKTLQIVIDSADPHVLADWWAEALGWDVEEQDETFIEQLVDEGKAVESDTTRHRGRLVWAIGTAIAHPTEPSAPRMLFQKVPEAKSVKNRVHWDLRGGQPADQAQVDRPVGLGATEVGRHRQGPYSWVVMTDPEGNEFCL